MIFSIDGLSHDCFPILDILSRLVPGYAQRLFHPLLSLQSLLVLQLLGG